MGRGGMKRFGRSGTSGAVAILLIAAILSGNAHAGVADLDWMSGTWSGPTGPDATLEENWIQPANGTIGAFVRMSRGGVTGMVELIVVEEAGDSLVLHIQQWDPGFVPRAAGAQHMALESLGDRTVSFRATSEGGLAALTYSRPADDTFIVEVTLADGTKIPITLKAQ